VPVAASRVAGDLDLHRPRRALRQFAQSGRESLVQARRAHPPGGLAQVDDRLADLSDRLVDAGAHAVGRRWELVLEVAQGEPYGDEALLGAVVQVALDAPSLLVAGRDDPLP